MQLWRGVRVQIAVIDAPTCPRCGYDQTGALAHRRDAVVGRCTECGEEFQWADIERRQFARLPGFFEHARGPRSMLTSAWRTWWWVLLPWRFWSRVRPHHRVCSWRAAAWLLVLWLLPLLTFVAVRASARFFIGPGAGLIPEQSAFATVKEHALAAGRELIWPAQEVGRMLPMWLLAQPGQPATRYHVVWFGNGQSLPGGLFVAAAAMLMFPLVLVMLRQSCRAAGITVFHVWRGFVFSGAWLGVAMLLLIVDTARWRWGLSKVPAPDLFTRVGTKASFLVWTQWYLGHAACWSVVVWLLAWWYAALSIGFGVKRAGRVWAAAALPAILASGIVWVVWYGSRVL